MNQRGSSSFLVILLLAVVLFAGGLWYYAIRTASPTAIPLTQSSTTSSSSEWQLYNADAYYSFEYPRRWSLFQPDDQVFLAPTMTLARGMSSAPIWVAGENNVSGSVASSTQNALTDTRNALANFERTHDQVVTSSITIGGVVGQEWTGNYNGIQVTPGVPVPVWPPIGTKEIQVFLILNYPPDYGCTGYMGYSLWYSAVSGQFENIFDHLIRTFQPQMGGC